MTDSRQTETYTDFLSVTALMAFLCSASAVTSALANDWPQWRGPNRDGASEEKGLLKEWPAGGPPLVWKAKGLGSGYSTVVVAAGRIYTTGDKPDASYVVALSEENGNVLWASKVGRPGALGWGNFEGGRSTPTVGGDSVFAIGQWGELVCLDAATSREKWRKDLDKDLGGPRPEWGFSESPLVDGGKVVVTPGGPKGTLAALDAQTGELLWRTKGFTDPAHYSSIITAEIDGFPHYIQLTEHSLVGVSPKDGQLLWRASRTGKTAVIPTPIYHENQVFVTSSYGTGCNLFRIAAKAGKLSAEQVYANKVMANHHGGVVRVANHVYGYSEGKGWTCQELKTGKAAWDEKGKLGKGSIVYADGRLYLRAEEGKGTVALIEATPDGYHEKGRFDQPDRIGKNTWAHPVIANGRLYLRDQDLLLCYDLKPRK